jgi:hypothetical protein
MWRTNCLGTIFGIAMLFTLMATTSLPASAQKKGGGGGTNTGSGGGTGTGGGGGTGSGAGGGSGNGGGGGGGQGNQQAAGSSPTPSSRIEAAMLAYESSDKIAKHIADQIKGRGRRIFVYDTQSFANLQNYDSYAAAVSMFQAGFQLIGRNALNAKSTFGDTVSAVQTAVSVLQTLRSSTEFSDQSVDFQQDALTAQVAAHLDASQQLVIPKISLFAQSGSDLTSNMPATILNIGTDLTVPCADLSLSVPNQMACLLNVRNAVAGQISPSSTDPKVIKAAQANASAFEQIDKVFQVFFGAITGSSVEAGAGNKQQSPTGQQSPPGQQPLGAQQQGVPSSVTTVTNTTAPQTNPANGPSTPAPLLSSIIQGHRLKFQLGADSKDASPSRILVLETTAAGGGSRIRHNFFVELFWTTPDPAFSGGAVVTFLLINPNTSATEAAGVLRYIYGYGKFDAKRDQRSNNFGEK